VVVTPLLALAHASRLAHACATIHLYARASVRREVKKCTSRPQRPKYDGKPGGVSS
jgi:hypothetical protein